MQRRPKKCMKWQLKITKLIESIGIKEYLLSLISIILLTDLVILLNILFLREVLGFLCFTIMPGLLILHILKLNKIEFLKKFVLSVGLSIVFLMFGGLLVNSFYPLILKPLSLAPILISFTIILMILAFIAYKRNKDDFDIKDVFNFKMDLKDKLVSPLIFPIIFPFMAVFGTHLMNTQENNIILLIMLFLIPAYVVAVVLLRDKISEATYPIAIWMIGMALLLMHGLTSYHLMGRDVHTEFYCFRLAASDFHWDISKYHNAYNACLSVTILPTIYQVLSNINIEYIFKMFFGLIGSITPLGVYALFKRYVDKKYAFLLSFLFIAQVPFIYLLQSATRQEIGLLFFVLAILVFFDDKIDKLNRKILFLIFSISVIVSHYTTAYIFLLIMLFCWLMAKTKDLFKHRKNAITGVNLSIILLFFIFIFFWYSQVTSVPFTNGVMFIERTFLNLGNFFLEDVRGEDIYKTFGIGLLSETIPYIIRVIINDIFIGFISIGILAIIFRKYKNINFDREYIVMMIASELILLSLILPFVSEGYGPTRIYLQLLVFLAPAFIIGVNYISKISKVIRPKITSLLIMALIISQFFCAVYLFDQIAGIPKSQDLNTGGVWRNEYYIYDQELVGARWLNKHNVEDLKIHSDRIGYSRLMLGYDKMPNMNNEFFKDNKTISSGYIYLRYVNVNNGIIYESFDEPKNITNYSHLIIGKSKIYNNGGSEVYT